MKVFATEGAVNATAKTSQTPANSVKETSVEEERQAASKDAAASLFQLAKQHGVKLNWVNCGLSVDERETGDWPEGLPAVGPKDLVDASLASDATMAILVPTK